MPLLVCGLPLQYGVHLLLPDHRRNGLVGLRDDPCLRLGTRRRGNKAGEQGEDPEDEHGWLALGDLGVVGIGLTTLSFIGRRKPEVMKFHQGTRWYKILQLIFYSLETTSDRLGSTNI